VALRPLKAFVAPLGAGTNRHALKLARDLRAAGVAVDVGDESFRLKKSFETAEKLGAIYVVLVGENEVAADAFSVKELKTSQQTTVARSGLAEYNMRTGMCASAMARTLFYDGKMRRTSPRRWMRSCNWIF
jgi:histidyl-tRNA synthetase